MLLRNMIVAHVNTLEPAMISSIPDHSISGQVTETSIPTPCRVRLHDRISGRLISEALTDALGRYVFTYLTPGTVFYVLALDKSNVYNAVMQDGLKPAPYLQSVTVDNVLSSTYTVNSVINIPITVGGLATNVVRVTRGWGNLPDGIWIENNSFKGTFSRVGYYNFSIRVLDNLGNRLIKSFNLWVGS